MSFSFDVRWTYAFPFQSEVDITNFSALSGRLSQFIIAIIAVKW